MTKQKRILLIIAAVVLAALALGAFRVYRFVDYDFESPRLATFASPDGKKSAYLLWYGALMGRTLAFFTSQTLSPTNVRWIGSVDADDSLTFRELIWSSDSSLVVSRCYVSGYCKLPEGTVDQSLLTHGIDLLSNDRFVPERDVFDATPQDWIIRHNRLEQLLLQKGTQRTVASQDNLHDHMKKLTWSEWRKWRSRLTKAKEQEANN